MKKIISFLSIVAIIASLVVLSGCSGSDYYKNSSFISDGGKTVVYETSDNNISWGKCQKDISALGEGCQEFEAGYISLSKTKEDFDEKVKFFKERLDILGSEYAFGFSGEEGDNVTVKINNKKLGLPVFALLNATNPYNNKIVSQMGDLSINSIKKLTYQVNPDSKYEITVEIPEQNREELGNYISDNIGQTLYLKLDELTFSEMQITETTSSEKLKFVGFSFLGTVENESEYEFIMKLAEQVVNGGKDSMIDGNFPTKLEEDETYNIPYVTQMDAMIIANINSLYPDVTFRRNGVHNNITIRLEIDPDVVNTAACLERVKNIYELCSFDGGAYSDISFTWPFEKVGDRVSGQNNYIIFKKDDGKMVCSGYADRIAYDVEYDLFFGKYIEK